MKRTEAKKKMQLESEPLTVLRIGYLSKQLKKACPKLDKLFSIFQ
ncbi:Uncharacterised protein [Paenibacillus macerans]|uniref:Uncharacterized protein n=1 Tax=Paenibacillus macerans TaxID=44252 RepID=A0A090YMV1_PAEMA|nr:hypothetical protein DJ90_4786 [Paenibacillus macerans]SUA86353.1 Uncharacterised protein [Paenibacillus macerans]